jgi:hypothetical protein
MDLTKGKAIVERQPAFVKGGMAKNTFRIQADEEVIALFCIIHKGKGGDLVVVKRVQLFEGFLFKINLKKSGPGGGDVKFLLAFRVYMETFEIVVKARLVRRKREPAQAAVDGLVDPSTVRGCIASDTVVIDFRGVITTQKGKKQK